MKRLKNLIYVVAIIFSVFTFGLGFSVSQVFAETNNSEFISKTSLIINNSFNVNNNMSSLETSFSGWTELNKNDATSITSGIINVGNRFSSNQSDYKLSNQNNPNTANAQNEINDSKILMINSLEATTPTWKGYKSNEISLDANSYYKLSVNVKTYGSAVASIAVLGLNTIENIDCSSLYINNIKNTDTTLAPSWKEYSFYITTNYESQKINLGLYLGITTITENTQDTFSNLKSVVFFDEISLTQFSNNAYNNSLDSDSNLKEIIIPTYNAPLSTTNAFDFNVNNNLQDWEVYGDEGFAEVSKNTSLNNFESSDKSVLKLGLRDEDTGYIGIKSPTFKINQAQVYKLSFYSKCFDDVSSVTAKLIENDYLKTEYGIEREAQTAELTITEGTNQLTNDYILYSFYITGYELFDTEVYLDFCVGTETSSTSGYIAIYNINLEYFPQSLLAESADNSTKLAFTSIEGTSTITNGMFNSAYSTKIINSYPLTPSNWTSSSNQENTIFGVVNTNNWANIPNANIPKNSSEMLIPENASNNILLAYNPSNSNQTKQVITSESFAVSANTTKMLSFFYIAYGEDVLNIKLVDSEGNVVFKDLGIDTNTEWKKYSIKISSEDYSTNLTIKLEVVSQNQSGYVFLDYFKLTDSTEATTNIVDFSDYGMHLRSSDATQYENLYDALMFKGAQEKGTQSANSDAISLAGIITNDNNYWGAFPNEVNDMLLIWNRINNSGYSLTSKNTIAITENTYYKFTIQIKTVDVVVPETTDEDEDYGAYFELSGLSESKLSKIVSNDNFSTYNIYLNCKETTTINFKFGLIGEGKAFFNTFNYSTIKSSDYANATNSENSLLVQNLAVDEEEEEEETSTTSQQPANIWILFSAIIMVIAVFIAIIGSTLRKIEIKKIKVKRKVEYDRKASLVRDISVVEAEKRRDAEIKSLNEDKAKLQDYIKELEEDNKKRIAEERKVLGKTITRKSEKEFKIYANSRQKLVKDIEKIDAKIKEAKSPEYLLRVVKVVQKEKVTEIEDKTTSTDTTNNA